LEKPRVLNATKCISYWTIESRQIPPPELRSQIGDHFFGCDLCQTVCPWNQKVFGRELQVVKIRTLNSDQRSELEQELRLILTLSGKQLQKKFIGTPLLRAGPFGLRRNALLVAANQKLLALKPEISKHLKDEKLAELAQWTLDQLGG
jgi:epoxyqueuosine reductase